MYFRCFGTISQLLNLQMYLFCCLISWYRTYCFRPNLPLPVWMDVWMGENFNLVCNFWSIPCTLHILCAYFIGETPLDNINIDHMWPWPCDPSIGIWISEWIFLQLWSSCLYLQHAHALELLSDHLKAGNKALDVGSGSGYLTACMALMVRWR